MFLIPFTAAFVSWLAMKVSMKMNPQSSGAAAQQQQSVNKSMELMMPLMSVWFAFIMPAALGIYWIINSVIGAVRDAVLTKVYTKKMDQEDAVRMAARSVRDAEIERKREETERLRAANATEQNRNTSKKKMQAVQKQKDDERRAAVDKAERAERRVRLGISEPEKPASQVGGRRYARGRAYVEDRYENPEGAEEATLAAAAESEFGEAIDENVEETGVGAAAEAEASFDALTEEESEAEFPEDEQFDDGADDATDDEQEKQEI
jgi:YidC/Oxa1 family membrane protein insertase